MKHKLYNWIICTFICVFLIAQYIHSAEQSSSTNIVGISKVEQIFTRKVSKTINGLQFTLSVIPGSTNHKTIVVIDVANKTNNRVSFPKPDVMPLCGYQGYKNTISVWTKNGELLKMTGEHSDYMTRPITKLFPSGKLELDSQVWCFELENYFPDLCKPGDYVIKFMLKSKTSEFNKSTWEGFVKLTLSFSRTQALKTNRKPQPNTTADGDE